jgi:Zn finger protein HypA/HybF involved in hydrogenase expression
MPDNPLVANLVSEIRSLAYGHRVLAVKVRLGAASPISLAELHDQFARATCGTEAQDARLDVETLNDLHDRRAKDVVIRGVEIGH